MWRRVHVMASFVCLAFGLFGLALWAASYAAPPISIRVKDNSINLASVEIWRGGMITTVSRLPVRGAKPWCYARVDSSSASQWHVSKWESCPKFGFVLPANGLLTLITPAWLPALAILSLALLLRPSPKLRFTLRELFVITTIVAIVASGFAVLLRLAKR
jgi:hypothetical protein